MGAVIEIATFLAKIDLRVLYTKFLMHQKIYQSINACINTAMYSITVKNADENNKK